MAAAAIVDGERWSVIRDRQPYTSLWRDEFVPEWLA
jgi:diaminopimelate decarboxylase